MNLVLFLIVKLSVSNIAWSNDHDEEMYGFLSENGFDGIEVAPTRIVQHTPYKNLDIAAGFSNKLKGSYNIAVSSVQSIWFGITESIFGSDADRQKLLEYTKEAVNFACALNCSNIVFGCPGNRAVPAGVAPDRYFPIACNFFSQAGDYAAACGTCIAIEPNPPIYNTNFINTTAEAFEICRKLNNPGIKVNIDTGTLIHNNESIEILKNNIDLINHIHISEPYLAPVERRTLHSDLKKELQNQNYRRYLSLEMSNPQNIELVKTAALYVKELYGDV